MDDLPGRIAGAWAVRDEDHSDVHYEALCQELDRDCRLSASEDELVPKAEPWPVWCRQPVLHLKVVCQLEVDEPLWEAHLAADAQQ
jgi:hypothetical protein